VPSLPPTSFFYGRIRNAHTRAAYLHAVKLFSALVRAAWDRASADHAEGRRTVPRRATKEDQCSHIKAALGRLAHFFDSLVMRHVILLNPALSVRGERYAVVEARRPRLP